MVWIALIVVAVIACIALACIAHRRLVHVLGQQMANAEANEAARIAAGPVRPSPMPKSQYDVERGDFHLHSVAALPLDAELRTLARNFRSWSIDKRSEAQRTTSMEDLYTLIHFAKRCAVLALRENSAAWCDDALTAISMIDETRIDPRDASWAVGLVSHAISATGADRQKILEGVVPLATPGMAKILGQARTPAKLSDWGYSEVRTEAGRGLIQTGSARYEPTYDMSTLALKISAAIERGRYTAEPELASELPAVWFAEEHRGAAEALLKRARAGIAIRGELRKKHGAKQFEQLFVQWAVEMATEREARMLAGHVGNGIPRPETFAVGVSSGRLFALLVAGSSTQGVAAFESRSTLAAFAAETQASLVDATRAPQPQTAPTTPD